MAEQLAGAPAPDETERNTFHLSENMTFRIGREDGDPRPNGFEPPETPDGWDTGPHPVNPTAYRGARYVLLEEGRTVPFPVEELGRP